MRSLLAAAVVAVASLGLVAWTPSQAHASKLSELLHRLFDPPYYAPPGGYYDPGYPPEEEYYDPGYVPYGGYYGRGGHDEVPHWHRSVSPYGETYWYGRGPHDDLPHEHRYGPDSYRGRVYTPWGYTDSYYPRYPYRYAPW